MMLNTDMGLLYGLNLDANFQAQCQIPPPQPVEPASDINSCGEVFTGEEVHEYSEVCKKASPLFNPYIDENRYYVYMLLYATLNYSTPRYSTLRYSTLLYATLRYSTPLYATLRYSMLLYATQCYSTLLYAALRCFTVIYAALRYFGRFFRILCINIYFYHFSE
jgi:hypothetical protein